MKLIAIICEMSSLFYGHNTQWLIPRRIKLKDTSDNSGCDLDIMEAHGINVATFHIVDVAVQLCQE